MESPPSAVRRRAWINSSRQRLTVEQHDSGPPRCSLPSACTVDDDVFSDGERVNTLQLYMIKVNICSLKTIWNRNENFVVQSDIGFFFCFVFVLVLFLTETQLFKASFDRSTLYCNLCCVVVKKKYSERIQHINVFDVKVTLN